MAQYIHMRFLSCLFTLWLFWPHTAFAATYYVSPSGNDSNSGTSTSSAWQTPAKVSSTNFVAGDQILFQGGAQFSGRIEFTSTDVGTPSNPITVSSYGSGRPLILSGNLEGLLAYDTAGFVVRNMDFRGSGSTVNASSGVVFKNRIAGEGKLDSVVIDQVDTSGYKWNGVEVRGEAARNGYRNVTISNVVAHDNANAGISVGSAFGGTQPGYSHFNVTIRNCKTYNNTGIAGQTYHTGNGIVISYVDGGIIEHSVAYNNGALNDANGGPIGIWAFESNNVFIQYNEAYANKTRSASDGGGFDLDGGMTNSIMQYNYAHDNDGAGFLVYQFSGGRAMQNNVVRYNISQNDGRKNSYSGLFVGAPMSNVHLYNNTIFVSPSATGSPSAVKIIDSIGTNVTFRNNIFVTTGGARLMDIGGTGGNATFQGNVYWTSGGAFSIRWLGASYASLTSWLNAVTAQERHNSQIVALNVDPKLTSPGTAPTLNDTTLLPTLTAYKLQSDSTMINNGLHLQSSFGLNPGTRDFYGNAIPNGAIFDRGAHEFVPTSTLPSPANLRVTP